MCGIAGVVGPGARDQALLGRMATTIAHRGPDDDGLWSDSEAGVALVHRRLSIVDLSPAGHQPMHSADGRWIVSYNGELYNSPELRTQLEVERGAVAWRGHSDTETLVESIAAWGVETILQRCVGMFALALWDRRERLLHLARDRFGEKPLYYGWVGRDFMFGSELKALRAHPDFDNAIDREALGLFAARAYVPAPRSIYRHIFKLEPGCILTVSPDIAAQRSDEPLATKPYWSYRDVVREGLASPILDEGEALTALEATLSQAIRDQSVADVPVGAFLSGGIDSSTIVALYQKYSDRAVRTFTIGFDEPGYNEADHARGVASHLGTEHHELTVTAADARDVIPRLPQIYDEPFADASQIPTYLVSRFARGEVTVALTGDGGDELFGGYNRHVMGPRLWRRIKPIPRPLRALAGAALGRLPDALWHGAAGLTDGAGPHIAGKLRKGVRLAAGADRFEDIYFGLLDAGDGASPTLGAGTLPEFDLDLGPGAPEAVRMMYGDAVSYLPGDVLCKVDRAAMAVSLETRVPFLDHRVAALAARIPLEMKLRGGRGKHILRELLYREAPCALFDRPKAGFAVPVGTWIKGPLRDWAEELLDPVRMRDDGFLDPAVVQRLWHGHLAGGDNSQALWSILMFQAWSRATPAR